MTEAIEKLIKKKKKSIEFSPSRLSAKQEYMTRPIYMSYLSRRLKEYYTGRARQFLCDMVWLASWPEYFITHIITGRMNFRAYELGPVQDMAIAKKSWIQSRTGEDIKVIIEYYLNQFKQEKIGNLIADSKALTKLFSTHKESALSIERLLMCVQRMIR